MGVSTRAKHSQLRYPDLFYLRAAAGWLDLDNPDEAGLELEQIAAELHSHPDVLALRWSVYLSQRKLDSCFAVASLLTEVAPNDERGWRVLARTLYLRGRVTQAYQIALAKVDDFSHCGELLYDMACYACLLGKRAEARQYLQLAMSVGDARAIKRRARKDPDLERLW